MWSRPPPSPDRSSGWCVSRRRGADTSSAAGTCQPSEGPRSRRRSHDDVCGVSQVRYEVTGAVCTLTLDNPDRKNAWNPDMEREYFSLLDRAASDREVRAIVVTGTGSSFCPGLDSRRLADAADGAGLHLEGRRSQHYALTIPKPMVAAINGACAGIGLVQALVCDVRFMARGARLSTAYAKLGIPAEYGLSWLLPRMIGVERALDLLLSARRVDADEAERIGLVSRVCEPDVMLAEAWDY